MEMEEKKKLRKIMKRILYKGRKEKRHKGVK